MYHYPFHLRDYVTKTRHLSLMEDLAYRRLLDAYYTAEGPLPLDPADCARLICMREHTQEVAAVLSEFFIKGETGWSNTRCEEEIAKYRVLQTKSRKGAAARWNAPGNASAEPVASHRDATGNASGNARAMPTKNQETITKPPLAPKGDFGFEEFWKVYPRKDAKASALKGWMKLAPTDALRAQIISHVLSRSQTKDWTKDGGAFVPHAATFINQCRWEDEVKSAEDSFWSNVEPWS